MSKSILRVAAATAVFAGILSSTAGAATVVDASTDNWGNAGAATGAVFNIGDSVTVTVDPNDLWGAGDPLRVSNAAGLQGDVFANSPTDDSQAADMVAGFLLHGYGTAGVVSNGDQLGQAFGLNGAWSFGSLVGQIGAGAPFLIGLGTTVVADAVGELRLFYWDTDGSDNFGSVTAQVVPLPAAVWLLLSGLAGVGAMARRRHARVAAA